MSKSVESLDLDDVIIAKSFPNNEISLPQNEIDVDTHVVTSDTDPHRYGNKGHDKPMVPRGGTEEMSHYDHIDVCVDVEPGSAVVDTEPTSMYELKGTGESQMLALKHREISTRQCKFEIGEEWEQFQAVQNQSVSCPSSPLSGKRGARSQGQVNQAFAAGETGSEPPKADTDRPTNTKEPYPFHYLFSAPPTQEKDRRIVQNPYNRLNQRFHSTLQCPCFLFFFFLCCLPAVHYMQWSELQFKKGNNHRAKHYGTLSTAFYIVGSLLGVAFLSVSIYFAADYVKQFVA